VGPATIRRPVRSPTVESNPKGFTFKQFLPKKLVEEVKEGKPTFESPQKKITGSDSVKKQLVSLLQI